jgi:hypothetical protein
MRFFDQDLLGRQRTVLARVRGVLALLDAHRSAPSVPDVLTGLLLTVA